MVEQLVWLGLDPVLAGGVVITVTGLLDGNRGQACLCLTKDKKESCTCTSLLLRPHLGSVVLLDGFLLGSTDVPVIVGVWCWPTEVNARLVFGFPRLESMLHSFSTYARALAVLEQSTAPTRRGAACGPAELVFSGVTFRPGPRAFLWRSNDRSRSIIRYRLESPPPPCEQVPINPSSLQNDSEELKGGEAFLRWRRALLFAFQLLQQPSTRAAILPVSLESPCVPLDRVPFRSPEVRLSQP